MKILSELEAKTLYRHLSSSIDPKDVFIQLLFETGARVSETLALSSSSLVGASLTVEPLKNSCPRHVTLSSNLTAKVSRLPPDLWAKAFGARASTSASRRRALDRHFRRLSLRLLGRTLNLHTLRHTAFTRLYRGTKDLLLVKQWAGHRSIASTLVYMALDREEQANAAQEGLIKALTATAD